MPDSGKTENEGEQGNNKHTNHRRAVHETLTAISDDRIIEECQGRPHGMTWQASTQ